MVYRNLHISLGIISPKLSTPLVAFMLVAFCLQIQSTFAQPIDYEFPETSEVETSSSLVTASYAMSIATLSIGSVLLFSESAEGAIIFKALHSVFLPATGYFSNKFKDTLSPNTKLRRNGWIPYFIGQGMYLVAFGIASAEFGDGTAAVLPAVIGVILEMIALRSFWKNAQLIRDEFPEFFSLQINASQGRVGLTYAF